jgi:phospholipid N-methyltransferase
LGPFRQRPLHEIPKAHRLFLQESFRSLDLTASVFPSSRYLASALLRPIDFERARIVVELGPGTGAVTNEILRRLGPDAKLLAIDINKSFINHLRNACNDPRLIPICGSATDLSSMLAEHGAESVDSVVSSLGLTTMDNRTRVSIMREVSACLPSNGTLTQYQYVHAFAGHLDIAKLRFNRFNEALFLRKYFADVSVGHVFLNLPPAFVFTCRK